MHAGFLNNQQNGLDLWIWASHNGIDGDHCRVSWSSNIPPVQDLSFEDHFTPEHRSLRWHVNKFLTAHQRPNHTAMWRLCLLFFFSYGESTLTPPLPTFPRHPRKFHSIAEKVWRVPGESWACLRPVFDFAWIHPSSGCDDTDMWCFCGAGRFSYGESPRTPPLEGTSLHR